jgi:hypothetical protein
LVNWTLRAGGRGAGEESAQPRYESLNDVTRRTVERHEELGRERVELGDDRARVGERGEETVGAALADELVDSRPGREQVLDGREQLLNELVKLGRDVAETAERAADVADLAAGLNDGKGIASVSERGSRGERGRSEGARGIRSGPGRAT